MKNILYDILSESEIEELKKQDQLALKKRLIGKVVDVYFNLPLEKVSPELASAFMEWWDNGDCTDWKDEAIMRMFPDPEF